MADFKLDEDKKVPFDVHLDHHEWVHRQKSKEELKEDMKKNIKTSLITGAIFSFFTTVAGVMWYAIQQFIANGGK